MWTLKVATDKLYFTSIAILQIKVIFYHQENAKKRQHFPQTFFLSIYHYATREAMLKFMTGEKNKLADNSINYQQCDTGLPH